ncbi:MAG: hypothetical protein PHQ27_10850 [Victivallales bacterium]|nr:hypothetical protein [Victivallales bacterium]
MPENPERLDLLKKLCRGGSAFLRELATDQLKEMLKPLTGHALNSIITTAGGAAMIAGMPLWPVALALAAGGVGLMVMKGRKPANRSDEQLQQITAMIQSLPTSVPTLDELRQQMRQLDLSTNHLEEEVEALKALLELRSDRLLKEIYEQREQLRKYFAHLDDRLDLFDAKLNQILDIMAHGPHFMPLEKTQNRYLYTTARVALFGRETEQKELQNFLADARPVAWLILSGPGGMGKSRLAYELCQQAQTQGWIAGRVDQTKNTENWDDWQPQKNTLLFLDYAEARMNILGPTLQRLCDRCNGPKIRLLLVVRQIDSGWMNLFMGDESCQEKMENCRFKELELPPLTDEALWHIVTAIVNSRRQEEQQPGVAPDGNTFTVNGKNYTREQILAELNTIDPEKRPLFAAMAADAIMDGKMSRQWNQEELLKHILHHEKQLWKKCGKVTPEDEIKYQNLMALSTLCRGFRRYDEMGQKLDTKLSPWVADQLPATGHWQHIVSMMGQQTDEETLSFLEPDLLGEFFVLEQLRQINSERIRKAFFLTALLNSPAETALTAAMIQRDYPAHPIATFLHEIMPSPSCDAEETMAWATYILLLSCSLPPEQCNAHYYAIYNLVTTKFPDHPAINLVLSIGAFNLIFTWIDADNVEKAESIFKQLESVAAKFPDHSEINLALARSASNLILDWRNAGKAEKAKPIYDRLTKLCSYWLKQEKMDFMEPWMRGFVNIMQIEDYPHPKDKLEIVREFQALSEEEWTHKKIWSVIMIWMKNGRSHKNDNGTEFFNVRYSALIRRAD